MTVYTLVFTRNDGYSDIAVYAVDYSYIQEALKKYTQEFEQITEESFSLINEKYYQNSKMKIEIIDLIKPITYMKTSFAHSEWTKEKLKNF